MAIRFDQNSITNIIEWTAIFPNTQGYQDKFLNLCKDFIVKSEFPNISYEIQNFKSGGIIFNQEVTPMLAVSFNRSLFKQLGIFFRAQQFGNLIYFTLIETLDKSLWQVLNGKTREQIKIEIRLKCKNFAQYEEYSALSNLGFLIFVNAVSAIDPDFTKNKGLFIF